MRPKGEGRHHIRIAQPGGANADVVRGSRLMTFRAHETRRDKTPAEAALWALLRNRRLGVKLRRSAG